MGGGALVGLIVLSSVAKAPLEIFKVGFYPGNRFQTSFHAEMLFPTSLQEIRSNSSERVQRAIDSGEDVEKASPKGMSPLIYAIQKEYTAALEPLIRAGADVTRRDDTKMTPLQVAAFHGRHAVIETLLATGRIDVDERADDGNTALGRSCWGDTGGHVKSVLALLAAGADPNTRLNNGDTIVEHCSSVGAAPIHEARDAALSRLGRKFESIL